MVKLARAEREIWRGACGLVCEWSVAVRIPRCVSRRNTRTSDAHWKCKIDTFWQENDARGLPKFCVERHTKGRSRSTRTPGHTHHAKFLAPHARTPPSHHRATSRDAVCVEREQERAPPSRRGLSPGQRPEAYLRKRSAAHAHERRAPAGNGRACLYQRA